MGSFVSAQRGLARGRARQHHGAGGSGSFGIVVPCALEERSGDHRQEARTGPALSILGFVWRSCRPTLLKGLVRVRPQGWPGGRCSFLWSGAVRDVLLSRTTSGRPPRARSRTPSHTQAAPARRRVVAAHAGSGARPRAWRHARSCCPQAGKRGARKEKGRGLPQTQPLVYREVGMYARERRVMTGGPRGALRRPGHGDPAGFSDHRCGRIAARRPGGLGGRCPPGSRPTSARA